MNLGELYSSKAISQIPRVISMLDRNEYSPTYGCFDRIFWLDKEIDFPSSILQLHTDNLALVYSYPYPNNPYYKKDKIRKWTFAGMDYWTRIQHRDGSFDEFYPNERGWAGPTGFLLFSMLDAYSRLKDEMPQDLKDSLLESSSRAAKFLAKYDEIGILANHHAMALLPIYYAYKILNDDSLLKPFMEKFHYLESLQSEEGWLLEYDGADPGYLSATVSFLGRIYKVSDDKELSARILKIVEKAIKFSSYFVYPNKFYGGTIGSRQTLHFYPNGYEIFDENFPIARKIADTMLQGLAEGKLVTPEIMPWRYLGYRIQEFLLAYIDYKPIAISTEIKLPWEMGETVRAFEEARMISVQKPEYYMVANLAKGGVIKIFGKNGDLIYNDCGIIGKLDSGKIVTTQWIEKSNKVMFRDGEVSVEGLMNRAPFKNPTPITMIAFRAALLTLGWNTKLSYWMKGAIRNLFITRTKKSSIEFSRKIKYDQNRIVVEDKIDLKAKEGFTSLSIGDEFSVRYVPQSLYFQSQELTIDGFRLDSETIKRLNQRKNAVFKRTIDPMSRNIKFELEIT